MIAKLTQKRFNRAWLIQQLKLNIVALISLVTAIVGISYNTWRDHQNEINDNMRNAAFEVLTDLGELQTIVNYAHFEADKTRGHPIEGWKHVVMVRDLGHLLTPDASKAGDALYANWQKHWENLGEDDQTELLISDQITKTRKAVLSTIDSLQ